MSLVNTLSYLVHHPLNQSNKVIAITRFLRWQLGSRLALGDVVYEWVSGSKVVVSTGETGFTGNIYCGLHEFSDMAFWLHTLRKDDLFVDIGANIGAYTILASSVVGAKGYCFEPVPSTYDRLMTNIRLNNLEKQVKALDIALGQMKGEIYLSSDLNCMNHVIADDEDRENRIIVNSSTLDEELKGNPFLMKIDVEGYETSVLEGAKKVLEGDKLCAVIIELNGSGSRYGYDESKILDIMFNYGFKTYSYKPFDRKLIDLNGKNLAEGNTIFIRNKERILRRIKNAPKIKIHNISI